MSARPRRPPPSLHAEYRIVMRRHEWPTARPGDAYTSERLALEVAARLAALAPTGAGPVVSLAVETRLVGAWTTHEVLVDALHGAEVAAVERWSEMNGALPATELAPVAEHADTFDHTDSKETQP